MENITRNTCIASEQADSDSKGTNLIAHRTDTLGATQLSKSATAYLRHCTQEEEQNSLYGTQIQVGKPITVNVTVNACLTSPPVHRLVCKAKNILSPIHTEVANGSYPPIYATVLFVVYIYCDGCTM